MCLAGEAPIRLTGGDIVVLPHGDTHVLASDPDLRSTPDMKLYRLPENGHLPVHIVMGNSGRPAAQIVCGFLGCDSRPYNPLLSALPRLIRVSDHPGGTLSTYVQFALAESKTPRIGSQHVLNHLSELMFIDVVRRHVEQLAPDQTNWLAGLRDPFVGRALGALHRDPARDWTIEKLARSIGLSRSALAERFSQFVGQPPMQYLARWRMQLAANQLRRGAESIAVIASQVGYASEAAFSRAFRKAVGTPPSQWRVRGSIR